MWPGKKLYRSHVLARAQFRKCLEEVGESLPEAGETDVDEKVGAAPGDAGTFRSQHSHL